MQNLCKYGFTLKEIPTDEKGIKVDIEQGPGANNVEDLPKGYKTEDIKIHANDGNLINLAGRVKMAGEMSISTDGKTCFMKVTKIEK